MLHIDWWVCYNIVLDIPSQYDYPIVVMNIKLPITFVIALITPPCRSLKT